MNNLDVLIILQTHSKGENQHYMGLTHFKRFVNQPKSEIMRRCTRSLVDSINYAKELLIDTKFKLVVLDDHSDEEPLNDLQKNLNCANFETELIHLSTHGIMPSILACYEYGKKYGKEIVYFVQDDYLYEKTAIYDMILTMVDCSQKLGNYASIYPFDDPYRYIPQNTVVQSHVVRCQKRHWRTQTATSSCFMTHHKIITDNWDLFYGMATHKLDGEMEDNTINKLWYQRGYYLLVPIPSLAFHMQYDTEKDDIADWATLWNKYERQEKLQPTTDKTVLNVGFGGEKIANQVYTDDLKDYREISLDIDPMHSPDIIADIHNISHIPDKFVDVVYSSHMIEHNHFFKVPTIINEMLRITKDDGFVRLVTPNLKTVGKNITEGKMLDVIYDSNGGPITTMDMIFGARYHSHKTGTDFMFHKCGFTREVFETLAKEHNWNVSITEDNNYNLIIDFKKLVSQ